MKKQIRKLTTLQKIQELRENNSNSQGQTCFRLLNHQRIVIMGDIKSLKTITKINSEM